RLPRRLFGGRRPAQLHRRDDGRHAYTHAHANAVPAVAAGQGDASAHGGPHADRDAVAIGDSHIDSGARGNARGHTAVQAAAGWSDAHALTHAHTDTEPNPDADAAAQAHATAVSRRAFLTGATIKLAAIFDY